MEIDQRSRYELATTDNAQTTSTTMGPYANGTASLRDLKSFSTVGTQPGSRLRSNSITMTTASSTVYADLIAISNYSSLDVSSTSAPTAASSLIPSPAPSRLSPSAAMGVGVAAGVIGMVIILTTALFFYRCWKVRQSPIVRNYEEARLWKGFTPATPSTARTTFVDSKTANMSFMELRGPATQTSTLSPPLNGTERSWPTTPSTTNSPAAELLV